MSTPAPQEQPQAINNPPPDRESHLPSGEGDSKAELGSVPATELERYNFDKTRVIVYLEILPTSEGEANRTVSIGVGIKNDPPLFATTTLSELNLPPVILQMLRQLESQMPERASAALQRKKQLQQQEERKQLQGKTSCKLPPVKPLSKSNPSPSDQQLTLF
jgi:hypothetical protein